MGKVIGFLGRTIKRAVTKDGGSLLKLRNDSGEFDLVSAGALAIRVGLAVGILYVAKLTGFTVDQIMDVLNQLGE